MVVDIYDRSTDPIVLWYELGSHIFRDFHAQEGRIEKIGGLVCHVCPFPLIHLLVIRPSICERVKKGLSIALALERWATICSWGCRVQKERMYDWVGCSDVGGGFLLTLVLWLEGS